MKALSNHQPQNGQVTSHHHQKMRKKLKLLPLSLEQKQKRPRKPASLKHLQQKKPAGSQGEKHTELSDTEANSELNAEAQKKARIAAAIAKAKAQKAAKNSEDGQPDKSVSGQGAPTQLDEQPDSHSKEQLDEKQARIAAAVAKAKAKKAASQKTQASGPDGEAGIENQDGNSPEEASFQSVSDQNIVLRVIAHQILLTT